MSQSEHVNHQFVTFWFAINETPESENTYSLITEIEVWREALSRIAQASVQHPLYRLQETYDGYPVEILQWELTEDTEIDARQNLAAFPVTFYAQKLFSHEILKALKELCEQSFAQVAAEKSATSRFISAESETQVVRTLREEVQGL